MSTTFAEIYAQQQQAMQTHVVRARKKSFSLLALIIGTITTVSTKGSIIIKKYRRGSMYTVGFGFIAYAGWLIFPPLGFAIVGISLFLLDALIGGNE